MDSADGKDTEEPEVSVGNGSDDDESGKAEPKKSEAKLDDAEGETGEESKLESSRVKTSDTPTNPFGAIDSKLTVEAGEEGKTKAGSSEFDDGEKGDDVAPKTSNQGEDEEPSKASKLENASDDDNKTATAFGRAKDEISEKGSTDELEQQVGKKDGESVEPSKVASKGQTDVADEDTNGNGGAQGENGKKSEQEKESTDELKQIVQSEEADEDTEEDAKTEAQAKFEGPSSSVAREDLEVSQVAKAMAQKKVGAATSTLNNADTSTAVADDEVSDASRQNISFL